MAAQVALVFLISAIVSAQASSPRNVPRKEVFTFISSNTPQGFYNSLPMENITTIGLFSDHPDTEYPGLLQLARSHGTKVVKAVSFDDKLVANATYRSQWVDSNVAAVTRLGYDGLNIDYEGNRHGAIKGFTELVVEAAAALRGNVSGAQLSIDAPGYAGFEFRDYDFKAIADSLDLMYVNAAAEPTAAQRQNNTTAISLKPLNQNHAPQFAQVAHRAHIPQVHNGL
jgi:hypothetical protein